MDFNKFVPGKVKKYSNTGNVYSELILSKNVRNREKFDLTPISINNENCICVETCSVTNDINIDDVALVVMQKFENILRALSFFQSSSFENYSLNNDKILLIQFEIDDIFCDLNSLEMLGLASKLNGKAVVILFATKNDAKFGIYWKSKALNYFLTLKPYNTELMLHNRMIFEYISKFLVICLSKNHLGIRSSLNITSENSEFELHFLADDRDYNILCFAADNGNEIMVQLLMNLGIQTETPFKNVNAQSLAYDGGHFDILLLLLQSNLQYPVSMDIEKCSTEVQNFIKMCNEVHDCIKTKNIFKMKEIIAHNKHLRYFYNQSNESVATTSIRCKNIEAYEELLVNNFHFGPHEKTDELMEELDYDTARVIRELHFKHLKELPENHMNILMANSFVGHDVLNTQEKINLVQHAFHVLNSIPLIRIILIIVAACRKFSIIFDFNRDTVNVVDPTSGAYTNGIFYVSGRIYIGARQLLEKATENEVFGTLAHELCHYALNLSFGNDAKPYSAQDNELMQEFEEISTECENNQEKEKVVDLVYECYPDEMHHTELAVRVPHMMALYHNQSDKLEECRQNFKRLFDFVENKAVPNMEKALPDIESSVDRELKVKDDQISKLRRNLCVSLMFGFFAIIAAILIGFYLYKPNYVFSKLSSQDQQKIRDSFVDYKNMPVKLSDLYPPKSDVYNQLTSEHITKILNGEILHFDDPQLFYLDKLIFLNWQNMSETLKEKILSSSFQYQGKAVTFEDIKSTLGYGVFESLPSLEIIDILNGKILAYGTEVESTVDFYVSREFIPEDTKLIAFEYEYGHDYVFDSPKEHVENRTSIAFADFYTEFLKKSFETRFEIFSKIKEHFAFKSMYWELDNVTLQYLHKTSSELVKQAEKEKILVLSSEAGSGKTVSFEQLGIEIKAANPTKHVSYVDLKDHVKDYTSKITAENVQSIVENILGIGAETNEFEKKLFNESYNSGNVVILWNGYDEISPTYNESVVNIIDYIYKTTKNIQYVCTRPLYSDQLSQKFKIRPWQLIPFNDNDVKSFLRKYFESKNLTIDKIDQNVQKTEEIMKKLNSKDRISDNLNTPLMLKLLAETHEDEKLFNAENLYEIYNIFVQKKIKDLLIRSSQGQDSLAKIISNSKISIAEIFQKYALIKEINVFMTSSIGIKMSKLQIMQKKIPQELPFEEISRMGILYIDSATKFEFAHRTFSEFFFAQYFIDSFYNPDESVVLNDSEIALQIEMLFQLIKEHGFDTKITKDFLASYQKTGVENKTKRVFHPQISYIWKTKFRNFFMSFMDTEHPKIFEFLFEFFKNDHDLLVELLHLNDNTTFYTAIFDPKSISAFTSPTEIIYLAKRCITDEELAKFVKSKHEKGKILLGMHIYKLIGFPKTHYNDEYNLEIEKLNLTSYGEFFDKIKGKLTIDEERELFLSAINPRYYAVFGQFFKSFDFSGYEKIWTNFEHVLPKSEMKRALGTVITEYFDKFTKNKNRQSPYLNFFLSKTEKFLNDSDVYEMFLNDNILSAAGWQDDGFKILWNFLKNHTNKEQRRQILLHDNGKYNTKSKAYTELSRWLSDFDDVPFRMLINSLISDEDSSFEFTKKIYIEHIVNESEIQKIVLDSNDFLLNIIGYLDEYSFEKLISFFWEFFKGNENTLKKFILKKVESTNRSVFQLVENFKGYTFARTWWFKNLKILSDYVNKEI